MEEKIELRADDTPYIRAQKIWSLMGFESDRNGMVPRMAAYLQLYRELDENAHIVTANKIELLRSALEPFVRGLNMHESGTCVTENLPVPDDTEPAKNVYVGDQRKARTALKDAI